MTSHVSRPPRHVGRLSRRHFLRAGTTVIALPALEAFGNPTPAAAAAGPRNFIAVGTYLGWHQPAFTPKQAGRDFELPPTLTPLADLRESFTVFSGLDHRAPNGHNAWSNFLCGMNPGSWSLDQKIADAIGQTTRFPSIELGSPGPSSWRGWGRSFHWSARTAAATSG